MAHHILIVDDDQSITDALALLFKRAGYAVDVASSGAEALQKLVNNPDLIVLDIMMPDVSGYEVCRQIRSQFSSVPILMLTARDQTQDKVLGLDLGADAYLGKPFETAELLAQMRALLRRSKVEDFADQTHLKCGDIQLCENTHRVTLKEMEIELTPKEYDLLRVLIRRPGIVFGRETLLREVWGYEYSGDTRTVDVHVQRLRAKIEDDPAQPRRLCTVRGFGYRFMNPVTDDGS
ncbi:MAG: response regulator transcription factor [Anaerolineales bacterium]|nr:response regulator transcription factor [Anaerolineales bacterium]